METSAARAESFGVLHDALYADLVRFVQRRADRDDVDDVVGETLVVWWRRFDEAPRELSQARAWVFATARQVLRNHHRGKRRRAALAVRVASVADHEPSAPAADVGLQRIDLAAAWRSLPATQQEALSLVVFEGLDATAAAVVAGIGAAAFRVRLSRARRAIRRHLTESPDAAEPRPAEGITRS